MEGILHSTPDGPSLCLQGGKQNGGGPRHQREACEEVSWEETLKDLPDEAKRSYGEALALGHQHSQGPDAHSRLLLGKRHWPPISSLPRAAGTSSAKSKKEGAATRALSRLTCTDQNQCAWNCRTDRLEGPASGSKHHLGSNLRSPRSASGRW